MASLAAFLFKYWPKARRKPDQDDLLALEVEKARQNILSGHDVNEVILRCYQQMSRVLVQEGGIEHQAFITPSEFEHDTTSRYDSGLQLLTGFSSAKAPSSHCNF
ncbi:MAG: hypothetical protein PHQ40_07200 [Anaerolineaceae bacterium]|nr:hypothetical protein [Anaerolineaceae bacterium]